MYFVRRHLGQVPVHVVEGWIASKEIQHAQLSYGIHSSTDQRRFCVSEHLWQEEESNHRGILDVMRKDSWPDDSKRFKNIWEQVKEGRYEHCRDAMMYFAVSTAWPPSFQESAQYAA